MSGDGPELDIPPRDATLDELRIYAERVSLASGMATVIVAVNGDYHDYVATSGGLARYTDPVVGALVEALESRLETIGKEKEGGELTDDSTPF
jgi:hypothetical protein